MKITTPSGGGHCEPGQSFDSNGNACPTPTPTPNSSPTPQVQVDQVGFKNDYVITRRVGEHVIDDNPDSPEATWVRTRSSTENEKFPAAYKMGTNPTLFAGLTVGSNPSGTPSADIRVKKGGGVIATKSGISLSGGTINVTDIAVNAALESPAGVKMSNYTFTWEISYNGGESWSSIGDTGPHIIYWTYTAPLETPFSDPNGNTFSPLYDIALEKSAGEAGGAADIPTIINNINAWIDTDVFYDPAIGLGPGHPLRVYEQSPPTALCADNAVLLRGLLRSIGIDAAVKWYWGGSGQTRYFYVYNDPTFGGLLASFRVLRDSHDRASQDPHFTYHAIVLANGRLYDPSYGISYDGGLNFDETYNPNTGLFSQGIPAANDNQSISDSYFPYSEVVSSVACPHPTPTPTPTPLPTPDPEPCYYYGAPSASQKSPTDSNMMSRPICY